MDSIRDADNSELLPHHRQALAARALTDEQIAARGYRSITDNKAGRELLSQAGIVKAGQRVPGLLLPLRRTDGSVWGYQYRPDNPRIGNDGRLIKYETAHRLKVGLDVPPGVDLARLTDPSELLLITEGVFKADAGAIAGLKIVGLIGVWNWLHTNDAGGKAIIPELYELAVNGGRVVLAFDGDICRKLSVQHAAKTLGGWLQNRGAMVEFLHLPDGDGAKTGLDDFLAAGNTAADVMTLVYPHLPPLRGEPDEPKHSDTPRPRPEFGSIDGAAVLDDVAQWFGRFIRFTHDDDIYLVALWTVHTHVARELYTTPRLQIDAITHGSGKTTAMEHLERLCVNADLNASTPSVALIARMIDSQPTTLLFDEIHRTLDPKDPETKKIYAIIDSGYRWGAKRPTMVQDDSGNWVTARLSTFAPVAMSGNSPAIPAESASRMLRINLLPDLDGSIEDTEWWNNEPAAIELAGRISEWADSVREHISAVPVDKPDDCRGRMWEKWRPLILVAAVAGGRWPGIATRLLKQDIAEEVELKDALMGSRPRVMVLLEDLYALWPAEEKFLPTEEILRRLMEFNAAFWAKDGEENPYGKDLTAKGLRWMIVKATKLTARPEAFEDMLARPDSRGPRGYLRKSFTLLWNRLHIADTSMNECATDRVKTPGASGALGISGEDSVPDTPPAPLAPDILVPPLTHSPIEYCFDCGTELTADNWTIGSYCLECLDERNSGQEPSDD